MVQASYKVPITDSVACRVTHLLERKRCFVPRTENGIPAFLVALKVAVINAMSLKIGLFKELFKILYPGESLEN